MNSQSVWTEGSERAKQVDSRMTLDRENIPKRQLIGNEDYRAKVLQLTFAPQEQQTPSRRKNYVITTEY